MAFDLILPIDLKKQGWKVKIRENERLEPPHVSIIRKMDTWRWDLRTQKFLDDKPSPKNVPEVLVTYIKSNISTLIEEWNKKYDHNKV